MAGYLRHVERSHKIRLSRAAVSWHFTVLRSTRWRRQHGGITYELWNTMLIALSTHSKDYHLAVQLAEWMGELGGNTAHKVLIVAASTIAPEKVTELGRLATNAGFANVSAIRAREEVNMPWPHGPNLMFRMAMEQLKSNGRCPVLWVEPDTCPMSPGWLDAIEKDYVAKAKPFYGAFYDKPKPHLNGVMIIPANVSGLNPYMLAATGIPFDLMRPDLTLQHGYRSPLIQRDLLDPTRNIPHTFPDQESLKIIKPGVLLFHGCKDGSLLLRLRERRNGLVVIQKTAPSWLKRFTKKPKRHKVKLSNVTLWAACWSDDQNIYLRTLRVLSYCAGLFEFERILLFAHLPLPTQIDFKLDLVQVPKLDMAGWNIFANRIAPLAITSDFAMSVHEDGFPVDAKLWNDAFLGYDYIGAPWKDGVVGNGGFCIESKKFRQAKMQLPFYTVPIQPSDYYVCRVHRKSLEDQGLAFAPPALAEQFSTELTEHGQQSFGFHGRKANPAKYRLGWQGVEVYESDPDVSVTLVYIHVPDDPQHIVWAKAFTDSYRQYPPGRSHRTLVVSQKQEPDKSLFTALPTVEFLVHDDTGLDIGAYLAVANKLNDEVMVCFGGSTYFQRAGWLSRMVQAWKLHGPGMYGATATYEVSPHLNTTAFWCSPKLLKQYPLKVVTRQQRYDFEHGPNALWKHALRKGLPVKLVTWCGEYDWPEWRKPENLFRRGTQANCLACWHHHQKYVEASPIMKRAMEMHSDAIIDPLFVHPDNWRKHPELAEQSRAIFVKAHQGFS